MTTPAFKFFNIPAAMLKPRKLRWTVFSDFSHIPCGFLEDFLENFADVIDQAKHGDHVATMGRLPAELLIKKNNVYRKFGIPVFTGGIPFELAYLQKQVEPYFARLPELGFAGVEISADSIPPIPRDERTRFIKLARKYGLEVFTEVGEKLGETAISAREAINTIKADVEAGATKVAIENNDLEHIYNSGKPTADGQRAITEIVKGAGLENIAFEVGPNAWPGIATWVIREFGGDINVENVGPDKIVALEALRRGISRGSGYPYFKQFA